MPIPKPRKGERQQHYISRIAKFLAREKPNMPNEQRIAIAYSTWRQYKLHHKQRAKPRKKGKRRK